MDQENKRFWIWTAGIIGALSLLAITGWFGLSAYRHYKEKHSLVQAQAFLAVGDFRNAWLSVRQTLLLNPSNVPACRVMATLADLSRSPAVLDWHRRMVEIEPSTENKLLLVAAGLRYQRPPYPLATQILEEMAATPATNQATFHFVATDLALKKQRFADAETHLTAAVRLEPTNQLYTLNLAIVQLSMNDEAKANAARTKLETMRADGNWQAVALRALVADRLAHKNAAAAHDYSTQLLADPHATLADQLQNLGILQQLKNGAFTARLQAVQRQTATNAPAASDVSAWMQANGLLAENIQWLASLPAKFQAQPPVRLALANAYLQAGDWPRLRAFASKDKWGETEFLRLALVAHAWSQLNEASVADSSWNMSISETDNRFGALTTLLGLAEKWKLPRQQMDLLQRIVQKFPQERWAQQRLEQLYYADGNTAALRQLYLKTSAVFPNDISLKNNLAATSLLLKTNLPQACRWAAEVYAQTTNDVFVASTYAFALHLQGRTKEGLVGLQKLGSHRLEQPVAALYYGVLLAATGATNQALPFLKIARTNPQWLPEEERLLAKARGEF